MEPKRDPPPSERLRLKPKKGGSGSATLQMFMTFFTFVTTIFSKKNEGSVIGTGIQYRYNPDHTVVFHSDSDRTGFKKPTSACKATGKRGRGVGGSAPTQNNPESATGQTN